MKLLKSILVLSMAVSMVFSVNRSIPKSELKKTKMTRIEPNYRVKQEATRNDCAHQYPNFPGSELTVIDSSTNGYGMVSTVTRPMDVNSDGNMLVVYRQYAGENTTHGQLGAGYSTVEEGELQWDVQYNVNYNGDPPWDGGGVCDPECTADPNCGCAQARYPSGIASEEYPYAIWNEYTGNPAPPGCSSYVGRPYYSFDEFGWGGESWIYPLDLDPLYDCEKDLWTGSVGYGYDAANGEHHVSVVYDDWTRTGNYLFTSEAVVDGEVILGTETLIVNPQHLGTDGYSSTAILSMNDNGQGLLGIDGIFAGVDMDAGTCGPPASNITCNKTPMFKLTDDFGQSWYGDRDAFDFYYIPDNVFEDIFSNWPDQDVDACTGDISTINDFWSWYEFDMRVDPEGNPHMVISLIAESETAFHFLDGYTGFYHFTIDRDYLEEPGAVNSPTGWNWSFVPLPANDSFGWTRPDGYSYLYGAMCQISLSRDNPDVVYMVANIAEQGDMSPEHDANGDGIEDDPCATQDNPWDLYPNWSEDIMVAKSLDNGTTWTGLQNVTATPRDPGNTGTNNCSPEEQYPHTAHWSDDDRVYFQYNQPNWEFNEIGDPLGADHMNRVFLGYSFVEGNMVGGCMDAGVCNYNAEATFDDGSCANVPGTVSCSDGSSGCDCNNVCFTYIDQPLQVEDCAGVCGGGAVQLCASAGGIGDCGTAADLCSESMYNDGLCNSVNSWFDCNGEFCGTDDPLFGCTGFPTCDGGRCYTCSDGSSQTEIECQQGGNIWSVETDANGNDVVTSEGDCTGDWVNFTDDGDDDNGEEPPGSATECYCSAGSAELYCEYNCPALGDLNGDGGWNVLDIVTLANCILANNCAGLEYGCAGDLNGDGFYNVLDIVTLANCILAQNCGGRVDDAASAELIKKDHNLSIEADGFIGGVQMTLTHSESFKIELTDRALYANSITEGNETRLIIVTPETDHLFSYSGDFEIEEVIVANSQDEVAVSLPVVMEYSLSQAYPNPFNPVTSMTLTMPVSGEMSVEVYNLVGQSVATLAAGYMDAGSYTLTWDANDVSSGMYFVKAQAEGFTHTQKLMLVK